MTQKYIKKIMVWNDILECWERLPDPKQVHKQTGQMTFNDEYLSDNDMAFIKRFGGFNSSEHMKPGA